MLKADGFDKALIGRGLRCGQPDVLVYDIEKCIKILAKNFMRDDPEISEDEALLQAEEYLEFNTIGAWVGPETPVWVRRATMKQIDEEEAEAQVEEGEARRSDEDEDDRRDEDDEDLEDDDDDDDDEED